MVSLVRALTLLVPALLLAACGDRATQEDSVEVYMATGAVQCEGGGKSLEEMARGLRESGIEPLGQSCGHDGMMRPAVCGAADGSIGIFIVSTSDQNASGELGFEPLASLPEATLNDCPGL